MSYSGRWPRSGTTLGGRAYALPGIGAPHRRDRLFLVAWPQDDPSGLTWLTWLAGAAGPEPAAQGALRPTPRARDHKGPGYGDDLPAVAALLPTPRTSDTNGAGAHGDGGLDLHTAVDLLLTPTTEPSTGNGHARCLGGEVRLLPTPTAADSSGSRGHRHDGTAYGPTSGVTLTDAVNPTRWGRYAAAIARWEHVLGRPAPDPTDEAGRLSPWFVEWLMGWPHGWVAGVLGRRPALRCCGNGVVTRQAVAALDLLARPALSAAQLALATEVAHP